MYLSAATQPSATAVKGYRMITDFTIENFRCFKQASLEDLRTINIVVGNNASGKTALLEGMFLATSSHPSAAGQTRIARARPMPQVPFFWTKDLFESFWEDLFHNFNRNQVIGARFTGSLHGTVHTEISLSETNEESIPASSHWTSIPPLVFKRIGPKTGDSSIVKLRIDEKGTPIFEGSTTPLPACYAIPPGPPFFWQDMANFYADLWKKKMEEPVVAALKREFRDISGVEVSTDATFPVIYVTMHSQKNRLPLSIVSTGIGRYLNILLAIAQNRNGVVFVDEIENGIYWEKMPNIWKNFRTLCEEYKVQLFAATHSNECLQSLIPAMKENLDDFSLIRVEVSKGQHILKQFYGKTFRAALQQHGEVR